MVWQRIDPQEKGIYSLNANEFRRKIIQNFLQLELKKT
jgi:hypothetical protein